MIVMPNIDSKIWDIEQRAADISHAMSQNQDVEICLNSEGPCCHTLGLYDMLDRLCDKFQYPKPNVTILTCNQLETHQEYHIKKMSPLYIPETQKFFCDNQQYFSPKTFNKDFKKFGIFIGRSNYVRLRIVSEMYSKYHDQTLLTFHYDCNKNFHRDHLGFDDLLKLPHSDQDIDNAVALIKDAPIMLQDIEESYPLISPAHLAISKLYHKFFLEIVCETYFTGNTFYPTEKIWRPLLMKTPFIVQGPVYYLDNLKKLGFKTFDRWWDEGHQHDPYDYQPIAILKTIEYIMSLSTDALQQIYNEMLPTLQHNHDRFMELSDKEFPTVFGYK